jgi:hypothetical protein
VIKINVCLRADTNPFLAALYGRHPVRPAVRPTVDFRPTEASKAAIRYDRFTSIAGVQSVRFIRFRQSGLLRTSH